MYTYHSGMFKISFGRRHMKIGVLFAALLFACGCVLAQPQPGKKPKQADPFEAIANLPYIPPPAPAPPEPPKRELSPIDRWRYDSCRTEASKAPTKEGVRAGLQVCHEKFGQ